MARAMLKDFDERWRRAVDPVFDPSVERGFRNRQLGIHPSLLIAAFLDPRFKRLHPYVDEASKVAIKKRVLELMVQLRTPDAPPVQVVVPHPVAVPVVAPGANMHATLLAAIAQADTAHHQQDIEADFANQILQSCTLELSSYLGPESLPIFGGEDGKTYNCPLEWWKEHESQYPTLAKLAKIYLAIQATSAPSERVFSVANRVFGKYRCGLDPLMAGMLLYVSEIKEWYDQQVDNNNNN